MLVDPEVFRALGALCEPPGSAHAAIAAALDLPALADPAEHTEVFVVQLVPYAAVYLGPEGMLGGAAGDRVAGFWRAVGHTPPAEPDHLAALLGLYAGLGDAERRESDPARRTLRRQARGALLWEHLLSWLPVYARAVARAGSPFYAAWAGLLADALLAAAADLRPPPLQPLQLRDVPPLPAVEDGVDRLVRAVLAPVRSGLVLTRRDLAEGARQAELGLRTGGRAFVLRAMLDQDPTSTVDWLAGQADRWADAHRVDEPALGGIARHWRSRAEATRAALLDRRPTVKEVWAHAAGH